MPVNPPSFSRYLRSSSWTLISFFSLLASVWSFLISSSLARTSCRVSSLTARVRNRVLSTRNPSAPSV